MNFLVSWSELFSAQVQTANSQQLAEALFHLGRLGYYNDNLLHKIVDLAATKSTDFGYREISQCLYGLGKLKFYDQEFISRIIMRFSDDLGQIQPTYIANLIYGVSKLEYYDQTFLDKFANIAITHMAKLNSQDVAEILLGVAKIGYHNQDLLNGIATLVGDSNFDQRSLINSSYALTLLLRNNNPDIANEEGATALFVAAYKDTEVGTKIVKLLLNSGAHANTTTVEGETPLLQAIMRNQESATLIL